MTKPNKSSKTRKKSKVKRFRYFQAEKVLEEFYSSFASKDEAMLRRVHLPVSDVFYVRNHIEEETGVRYSLDHVERAMFLEGYLKAEDCFEPERVRESIG